MGQLDPAEATLAQDPLDAIAPICWGKPGEAGNRYHDTLLWYPLLSDRSRAGLILRLPERPGVYRVRVEGHDAAGRLGATEATIQVAN